MAQPFLGSLLPGLFTLSDALTPDSAALVKQEQTRPHRTARVAETRLPGHGASRYSVAAARTARCPAAPGAESKASLIPHQVKENGRYMPSLLLAFRIARFFDLPIDKMFVPDDNDPGL